MISSLAGQPGFGPASVSGSFGVPGLVKSVLGKPPFDSTAGLAAATGYSPGHAESIVPEILTVGDDDSAALMSWLKSTSPSLDRARAFCDGLAALHAIGLVLQYYLLHDVDGRELVIGALLACLVIALRVVARNSERS